MDDPEVVVEFQRFLQSDVIDATSSKSKIGLVFTYAACSY